MQIAYAKMGTIGDMGDKTTFMVFLVSLTLPMFGFLIGYQMAEIKLSQVSLPPMNLSQPLFRAPKKQVEGRLTTHSQVRPHTLADMCAVDWKYWVKTSSRELESELLNRRTLFSQDCRDRMMEEIDSRAIRDFVAFCQDGVLDRTTLELAEQCVPRLEVVRGYVVGRLNENFSEPIDALSVDELQSRLQGGLLDLQNRSLVEINRNIDMADALTHKDPSSPMAYKAKLVNMLVKEIRFGQEVDLNVYDELLARSNEFDLVHLPFLRLSALGQIDELREAALNFIDRNPDSYVGYLYLAESLWREGNTEAALSVIQQGVGEDKPTDIAILFAQLQHEPLDRIYQLVDYN